jgi:hypothetical protein
MLVQMQHPEIIRANGAIIAKYAGGAIKRVSANTFEGHGVRWHDANRMDLTGEWFSKKTYFMLDAGYPVVGIPTNYQHGMHKSFGNLGIGIVSFATEDDIGLFIRGELKTREEYIAMLREIGRKGDMRFTDAQLSQKADLAIKAVNTLIAEVPLQFSGGFDPSTWSVDPESKHIDQSGMIHLAFTPTPADDLNPMVQFKSAWDEVIRYESNTSYSLPQIQPDDPTARKGGSADGNQTDRKGDADSADVGPTVPVNDGQDNSIPAKETNTMDEQMLRDLIRMVLEENKLSMQGELAPVAPTEDEILSSVRADAPAELPKDEAEMAKSVAKMVDLTRAAIQAHRTNHQKALDAAQAHLKRTGPAIDTLPAGGNGKSFGHAPARVEGVKDLRTAHLSAGDMALGLLTLRANAPKGMKFADTQFVSVEYLKAMQSKAEHEIGKDVFKDERNEYAMKAVMPRIKANELDASNISGQGEDWVSDWWSSTVWEAARSNRVYNEVLSRGVREEIIPEGADNATFPTEGADPIAYVRNQANSLDSTGRPQTTVNINPFGTGKVTVTPNELSLASAFTTIEQEDSIIPIVKQLNYQFGEKMEETIEQALINGDTATAANTNINLIDGTPGTGLQKPYYQLTDGWLKHALVTYTAFSRNGGALDENDFRLTVKLLNRTIRNRKDKLIFLMDSDTYNTALDIVSIKTDDVRMKRDSTMTSGNLEEIWGYKTLETGFMDLANSSGKVPLAGGTLGRLLLIYPPYWGIAWKRRLTIENVYDPLSGTYVYVATMRMGMVARSNSAAAVSYNLTIA